MTRQIFFEGKVQGVGFRYTVKQLAKGFDVTGWVRNLPDGRVELQVAADEEEELDEFVTEIRASDLAHHIQNVYVSDIEPAEPVVGFSIR